MFQKRVEINETEWENRKKWNKKLAQKSNIDDKYLAR